MSRTSVSRASEPRQTVDTVSADIKLAWLHRPLLVVSPHLDDAMLSAWALVTGKHAAGEVTVMTVFAGSPDIAASTEYDESCGFENSSIAIASRRIEDERAFAGLAAHRVFLDYLDVQYRNDDPLPSVASEIVEEVAAWCNRNEGGVVVMPAGSGGTRSLVQRVRSRIPNVRIGLGGGSIPNVDHLWLTDLLVEKLPSTEFALYDEQPYSWVKDGQERATCIARRLGRNHDLDTFAVDVAEKARRCEAYKSQMSNLLRSWVPNLAAVLPKTEKYWHLPCPVRSETK